jgi:hypothetical protein
VSPSKRQLAASVLVCPHIADREAIAGFLADAATQVGINPFPKTSIGAQLQTWIGQSFEFRSTRTEVLGLSCLLNTLRGLPGDQSLAQEILQAGPYRAYVYHHGDGCQIIGSVLHAKPGIALPVMRMRSPRRRQRGTSAGQLDLFVMSMPLEGCVSAHERRASL